MSVAVFDYTAWTTRYPEFGAVSEERAALFFAEAGLYLDNGDNSLVADVATRLVLLNLVTAHIATLAGALEPGGQPSGIVGRLSSATEGGVSTSFDTGLAPGTAAWFQQTSYGFAFWQATKGLRSATYIPAPPRITDPWRGLQWRR